MTTYTDGSNPSEERPLGGSTGPHVHIQGDGEVRPPARHVFTGPGGTVDLDNLFSYHPPTPDQIPKFERIRAAGGDLAALISDLVPACPERSKAISDIRQAVMWANAGIACNPSREPDEQTRSTAPSDQVDD